MILGRARTVVSETSSSTRRKIEMSSVRIPIFRPAGPVVLPTVCWAPIALLSAGWNPPSGSLPASRLLMGERGFVRSVKSISAITEKSMPKALVSSRAVWSTVASMRTC